MNGKLAKAIRRQVYGNKSYRGQRLMDQLSTGAIANAGIRREYLYLKKKIKEIKQREGYDAITINDQVT